MSALPFMRNNIIQYNIMMNEQEEENDGYCNENNEGMETYTIGGETRIRMSSIIHGGISSLLGAPKKAIRDPTVSVLQL